MRLNILGKFTHDQSGQGLTEYIIIVALVAIAAIGAVSLFGKNVQGVFHTATDTLNGTSVKDSKTEKGGEATKRSLKDFGSEAGK